MQILNVGTSHREICGVRDYALGLADELTDLGHQVFTVWPSPPPPLSQCTAWLRGLSSLVGSTPVDIVLWHYSVFSYGRWGIPYLAPPFARRIRLAQAPLVVVLHEYVFPWRRNGWRGALWGTTQRLALPAVTARSHALVVTVEDRARLLQANRWMPPKAIHALPVFSNLPPRPAGRSVVAGAPRIGVFGFPSSAAPLTMAAMSRLHEAMPLAELWLLGVPGADSPAGKIWLQSAQARGIATAVHFSGPLPPAELADELVRCDLCVFNNGSGPSSRNGTLAALLAAGTAVVAVDGPNTWRALVEAEAVHLVPPHPSPLADALIQLLGDPSSRAALGDRGLRFYRSNQDRRVIARGLEAILLGVLEQG